MSKAPKPKAAKSKAAYVLSPEERGRVTGLVVAQQALNAELQATLQGILVSQGLKPDEHALDLGAMVMRKKP